MAIFRRIATNAVYIRQQLGIIVANTSKTVKTLCVFVILGYLLSFWNDAILVLSVTPGYVLPPAFQIWTLITFCMLEIHFWEVIIDIISIELLGKLIEPIWGALEMVKFFVIVNVGTAILSALFYIFIYMITSTPELLFETRIYGLSGYLAAVTVTGKQILPDILVTNTPIGKVTNKHIPLIIIIIVWILWIVGLCKGTYPTMITSGMVVSWTYLRFYQRHSNGNKGDMSDSFSFSSFFPSRLQPIVSVLANTIYSFLLRIKLCKKMNKPVTYTPSPFTFIAESQDAERRRRIALKELTERLGKSEIPVGEPLVCTNLPTSPKQTSDVVISMPPIDSLDQSEQPTINLISEA